MSVLFRVLLFGLVLGVFGGGLFAFGQFSMRITQKNINKSHTHARATPPPPAFACNGDIFLREIVSCTSYGATLWDSVVGYGVFPRRFYSDCTDQFLFCQQNNYFLDVNSLSHYY